MKGMTRETEKADLYLEFLERLSLPWSSQTRCFYSNRMQE